MKIAISLQSEGEKKAQINPQPIYVKWTLLPQLFGQFISKSWVSG